MPDLPRHPDHGDDDRPLADRGSPPNIPGRSTYLLAIAAGLIVVAVVVLHLVGVLGPGGH